MILARSLLCVCLASFQMAACPKQRVDLEEAGGSIDTEEERSTSDHAAAVRSQEAASKGQIRSQCVSRHCDGDVSDSL